MMKLHLTKLWINLILLNTLEICHCANDIILSDVKIESNEDVSVENHVNNDAEPFIPTKEWQVVKPNQAVPAGLHIRMNFQTGIKEAKLLENVDSKSNKNKEASGPKITISQEDKDINEFPQDNDKIYFTKDHLKQALHEFRDKVGNNDVNEITWSADAKKAIEEEMANQERVKKKFRSMDEIRRELEETMKLKIKSDTEIMKELTQLITSKNSTENVIGAALDNLEYYVHQIDNGMDLNKIGGLEPIVMLLNSTNEDIQERAANVIGAATQNNKKVQVAVLHYGGLRLMLQMLHKEKKALTKKKALFALSAIARQNLNALNELIKLNGIESIINVIKDKSLVTSLHVKAIDLLFDLIEEYNDLKVKEGNSTDAHEGSPLLDVLSKSGLCDELVPLLNTDDFYTKEKIMHAIKVSVNSCNMTFKKTENLDIMEKELLKLKQNIKEEDDVDFKVYLESLREQLEKKVLEKLRS